MITEYYVSFKTAKLLKEKGFDEPLNYYYNSDGRKCYATSYNWNNTTGDFQDYSCPTLQMTIKWLRIEHNLFIEPYYTVVCGFRTSVTDTKTGKTIYTQANEDVYYSSPEASCDSIIQYCLKHLI